MRVCDDLRHEHTIVLLALKGADALSGFLRDGDGAGLERAGAVLGLLTHFVDRCHHAKEERHLFPLLAAKAGALASVTVMLVEHEEARRLAASLRAALEREDTIAVADGLAQHAATVRAHIDEEEGFFFPLADRVLGESDQLVLKGAFDRVEAEEMGAGEYGRYIRLAQELGSL